MGIQFHIAHTYTPEHATHDPIAFRQGRFCTHPPSSSAGGCAGGEYLRSDEGGTHGKLGQATCARWDARKEEDGGLGCCCCQESLIRTVERSFHEEVPETNYRTASTPGWREKLTEGTEGEGQRQISIYLAILILVLKFPRRIQARSCFGSVGHTNF
jgi:hypothetical protein